MFTRDALHAMHDERGQLAYSCDRVPVQIGLAGDPWKVLVASQLLNKTPIHQARPVLRALLAVWPTPEQLARAVDHVLHSLLHPLGFGDRRPMLLAEMSRRWCLGDWDEVWELPGVGQYAEDSVRIFCYGDWSFEPSDKVLKTFVQAANLRMQDRL